MVCACKKARSITYVIQKKSHTKPDCEESTDSFSFIKTYNYCNYLKLFLSFFWTEDRMNQKNP